MESIKPIETYYNGYRFRSRLEARWAVFFDALGVKYEYEPEGFQTPAGYYLPDFRVKCYGTRGAFESPLCPCEFCKHRKAEVGDCCYASPWSDFCELFSSMECYEKGSKYPEWIKTRDGHSGEVVECEKQNPKRPFDLWIEVKGKMTQQDKEKIESFSNGLRNPILIVHKIPNLGCATCSSDCESYARMNGFEIYPFNYHLIDGDCFAAYPAATKYGEFYLFGDDSNYINMEDVGRVEKAYTIARQARFEHGETPII